MYLQLAKVLDRCFCIDKKGKHKLGMPTQKRKLEVLVLSKVPQSAEWTKAYTWMLAEFGFAAVHCSSLSCWNQNIFVLKAIAKPGDV